MCGCTLTLAEVATHGSTVVLHAAGIVGGLSSADMMSMMMVSLVFYSQVKSASSTLRALMFSQQMIKFSEGNTVTQLVSDPGV